MPLTNLFNFRSIPRVGAARGGHKSKVSFSRMETISMEERPGVNNNINVNNEASWLHNNNNNNRESEIRERGRVPTLRDFAQTRESSKTVNHSGPMQKYFPLLCIVQTILICIFIIYLYWNHSLHRDGSRDQLKGQLEITGRSNSLSKYRIYSSNNSAKQIRFLLDLPSSCDQRKHDLLFGSVRCASKNTFQCEDLTSKNYSGDNDNNNRINDSTDPTYWAQIITTSKGGKRLHSKLMLPKESDNCRSDTVLNGDGGGGSPSSIPSCDTDPRTRLIIEDEDERQSIIGWGGALTDSSINNILSLSINGSMRIIEDYFGPNGLRFNMVRITIGGSDFSARFYTNNDKLDPNEPDDVEMNNFHLTPEDTLYKIPILRYIQDKYGKDLDNEIKIFASMWSPPTWMKTNNHFNKGQLKGSISMTASNSTKENEKYFKALAELKKKFILAYQRESIKFWGLTVMNEPVFAKQPFLDFNTMIFPEHDYASYIAKYLGPTLERHPGLSHIKLMAHDDNRKFLLQFTEPIMNNPAAGKYIDGVSVHGYADKDYHQMETFYQLHQKKPRFVLPTELCSGHLPWMQKALAGNWHRGVHYALDIIHSLQHSAAGWVDWNMALDMEGGPGWLGGRLDSPVLVDKDHDLYHKSPMFYVLGQFSRYIPPGSVRISSDLINGAYNYPLETVTFRLPTIMDETSPIWFVTVILNANPHPITVHIGQHKFDKLLEVRCDADSVTTVKYIGKIKEPEE